jgi:hypothetical protein
MKKLFVPLLVLGLGLSSAALAQSASDFVAVDADTSGDISLVEAQAVWAELTAEVFAAADTNADGKVDQTEYEAFLAANPPAM